MEGKAQGSVDRGSKDKFFILKSVGKRVVKESFTTGTYSVQPAVGSRLNKAFFKIGPQNAHAHVYVIVSTKRSKAFQAMGRMESLCKEEPNGSRLRFSIEWLSESAEVPFQDVEHVKQRKNSPFSVTASQDGQEIGGSAGKYLSYLLLKPTQEGEESPKDQPNTHTADEFEEGENPRMQEKEIECLHKELKTARVPERFLQCPPTILPPQHPVSKSEIEDWSDFEVYFQEL